MWKYLSSGHLSTPVSSKHLPKTQENRPWQLLSMPWKNSPLNWEAISKLTEKYIFNLSQPKTVGDVNAHIPELVEREKLEKAGEGSEDEDEDEAWKCINLSFC